MVINKTEGREENNDTTSRKCKIEIFAERECHTEEMLAIMLTNAKRLFIAGGT